MSDFWWDGHAAMADSDAALEALRTGSRRTVAMRECPGFYAAAHGRRAARA